MSTPARLPVLHNSPAPPEQFPVGALVVLKNFPDTPHGIVRGVRRGRILVHWSDMNHLCKHTPSSSLAPAKLNPDLRVLKGLDADRAGTSNNKQP